MENASAVSRLFEVNLFAGLKIAQAYGRRLADTGQRGRLMVTASENSLSLPSAVKRSKNGVLRSHQTRTAHRDGVDAY